MEKHRMSHIYCCKKKGMHEFLCRSTKKNCQEGEDRDNKEFWENQKVEYLQKNPSHQCLFAELEEEEV